MGLMDLETKPWDDWLDAEENGQSRQVHPQIPIHLTGLDYDSKLIRHSPLNFEKIPRLMEILISRPHQIH